MIDIKLIRENMPLVKAQLARRGCDANVEEIAELDAQSAFAAFRANTRPRSFHRVWL